MLWLQVIIGENDIQKNCSSGTFQPRMSLSGTEVQEGGSSWLKCPFVPDNDFVVKMLYHCKSFVLLLCELSLHYLRYLTFFQVIITSIHLVITSNEEMKECNLVAFPNTITHGTYIIWNVQIWQTQLSLPYGPDVVRHMPTCVLLLQVHSVLYS